MTFDEASKALKKVGMSRAEEDTLRAMYADMIPFHARLTSGKGKAAKAIAQRVYAYLQTIEGDALLRTEALSMMRNPLTIWDKIPNILG